VDNNELYKATKAKAYKTAVLLLEDNPIKQKLAVAWGYVQRDLTGEGWENCHFSMNEWCSLAGLPVMKSNLTACENLMATLIVLPDGRLNHWVEKHLDTLSSMSCVPSIKGKK